MKVGIVTSYAVKQPAGLERFLLDLLRELDSLKDNEYVVYTKKGSGFASVLDDEGVSNISVIEVGFGKLWKDIGLFFSPKVDAYLFNGPIVPFLFAPKNYFLILHDFAYKSIKPNTIKEKINRIVIDVLTRKAVQRAKKIITVSNTTKKELSGLYGVEDSKVTTIYPGFKHVCSGESQTLEGIEMPYFLSIGTLKERKNILSIISAFAKYVEMKQDSRKLVIVGKCSKTNPYVQKLFSLVEKEGLQEKVIFTDHVSDQQVSYLYKHADALIFPSLIEGFGFPALEAMSCEVPVITSNHGALAEISQDAAIQVPSKDINALANAMKHITEDDALRTSLIQKGLNRSKDFSWKKAAHAFEKVLINNTITK